MLRRLRLLIGLHPRSAASRRLVDAKAHRRRAIRSIAPPMLETVHEVAIYLHRFHNLDLFQQGWYQMKISMRWEGGKTEAQGVPARVVQYEAPSLTSDDILSVWKIDDADNSFSTQPFRIKYARQDVLLSVMISFNLSLGKDDIPATSAVILKFELMYAPFLENGSDMQGALDTSPASIHEFRIPPKALLGLHAYCPVHFDAFHSVLVDLSIHIVFLRAGTNNPKKVTSNSPSAEAFTAEKYEYNQAIGDMEFVGSRPLDLIKSLLASRDILHEELQNIGKTFGHIIDDLTDADSKFGLKKHIEINGKTVQMEGSQNGELIKVLETLSKEELFYVFHHVGSQLSFLWNTFLNFHRMNRAKILELLRDAWASNRKAEWSIWMVHSKTEIPHRYLKSGADENVHHNILAKASLPRKLNEEPAQTATARSDLHRRSIAQMKINSRSIQDMHIFGDPSRVPVILVEQHTLNVPVRASSYKSSLDSSDQRMHMGPPEKSIPKSLGLAALKNGRSLKVVVFVHGFQGHHLDLRLVRNQWLLIDPTIECLMSEANEEKTSGDFREMGSRLAEEVSSFLRKKIDKGSKSGCYKDIRLSFVGHSIGNIIIRTALTEGVMEPYLQHLYTYMSLSGPHLGYCYSSNSLFNSGLWLLKKLKGSQCIHQLTFSDDPDLHNTFFYKLCKQKTLERFRNIILLSSPQDGYVPYHSARIELCQASSSDNSKKAQVFMEMLNNCLDQIRAPSSERRNIMRCDVNFDMSSQGRSLNSIIGRAAHIEFLETDIFARFIMWSYPELFT